MIQHQLERIGRSELIDRLCVATSDDVADKALADFCRAQGYDVYVGSLDDVLSRYCGAARQLKPDHVVRLTGDCPLADPAVIDDVIRFYLDGGYDFVSNGIEPTFPDGLDVAVFGAACLYQSCEMARLPSEREHVTPYMKNSGQFTVGSYTGDIDNSSMRWTVDEPEDLAFVIAVYERLYGAKPTFGSRDVLDLLAREPALATLNEHHTRNEGMQAALHADGEQQYDG